MFSSSLSASVIFYAPGIMPGRSLAEDEDAFVHHPSEAVDL